MTEIPETDDKKVAIVGGGVHGTHTAARLLDETALGSDDILIFEPRKRLLGSFREKARACGMEVLRSSFTQHVGTEPYSLEEYAETNDREDELVPTVDYPPRPTVDLFLDHARDVIETYGLESVHREETVERIRDRDGPGLRIETSEGAVHARTCVLAVGHGGRYRYPDWATGLDAAKHVWDGFDAEDDSEHTAVVGGGITAAHLACELTETEEVTLLTRHSLEWEIPEADPHWINWFHIESELHGYPPGSKERYETAVDSRRSATIPPYFYPRIESRLADGRLRIGQVEVADAGHEDGRVVLTLEYGDRLVADRVVLATGFEPVFDHPFVERLRNDLGLESGYRDLPVLEDETLAWCYEGQGTAPVYVSGQLALGTVGPLAATVAGARTAAERTVPAVRERLTGTGSAPAERPARTDPVE